MLAHKLDHLREYMTKIGLSLDLKQQLPQFIIKFGLFLRVTTPNIFLVANKDLDEHVVIIVVIFCHWHPPGYNKPAGTSQLHRLVLSVPQNPKTPSAGLLHVLPSRFFHHFGLLQVDLFLFSLPFLRFFDLHANKTHQNKIYMAC